MCFTLSRVLHAFLAISSICITGFASGQEMNLGLWEVTARMSGEKGSEAATTVARIVEALTKMSPEQREEMTNTLGTKDLRFSSIDSSGMMILKICEKGDVVRLDEVVPKTKECTTKSGKQIDDTYRLSFICTKPSSGLEGEVTFQSSTSASFYMITDLPVDQEGRTEKVTIKGNGKFLSIDCGNMKP